MFARLRAALFHFVATCSCPCGCATVVDPGQARCSPCASH